MMDMTMPVRCPKGHLSTDTDYCSECGAKMPAAPSGLESSSSRSARSGVGATLAAAQSGSTQVCPDCGTPRATPTATFCELCRYNFVTGASWAAPTVNAQPLPPLNAVTAPPVSTPAPTVTSPDAIQNFSIGAAAPDAPAAVARPDSVLDAPLLAGTVPASAPVVPNPVAFNPVTASAPVVYQPPADTSSGLTQAPIIAWEAVVAVDPALYTDPDPAMPCPVGEPERVYPLDLADNLIGRRSEKRDIFPEINLNDGCVSHRHAKIQRQPDGSFALLDVGSTNGTNLNGVEIQRGVRTPLQDGDEITLGCWTRITIRGLRS